MTTPYGRRRVTYADYTASGRALTFIEDAIRDLVLPAYANTHTESSGTGLQTTRLREDAREVIRRAVHGDDDTVVVFTGSGSTAAIDKIIGILGLRIPSNLEDAYHLERAHPRRPAPGRLHRPVRAPLQRDPVAGVDRRRRHDPPGRRRRRVRRRPAREARGVCRAPARDRLVLAPPRTSPASSPTPTPSRRSSTSTAPWRFWDFAAAGPYVDIEMTPPAGADPAAYKDAVFLSPHKFIGGPATPGLLVARRQLFTNRVPDVPGRRDGRLRQRRRPPLPRRPGPPGGGRHPGDHRGRPGGPRLHAQGRRRGRDDPGPRGGVPPAGRRGVARRAGPGDPRRRRRPAAVDRVVRRPGAVRAATSTTTSSSPSSTTSSASSPAAAARAPGRTATGCSASTSSAATSSSARSPTAARGSSPAGCG